MTTTKRPSLVPKNRLIPAILLLSVLLLVVLVSVFLNGNSSPLAIALRIISLMISFFFIIGATYEITKVHEYTVFLVIPMSLIMIAATFVPPEQTRYFLVNDDIFISGFPTVLNLIFHNYWLYVFWALLIFSSTIIVFTTKREIKKGAKAAIALFESQKQPLLNYNFRNKVSNLIVYNLVCFFIMILAIGLPALLFTSFELFLFLAFIPVISDSFGFFGGKLFGKKFIKHDLIPKISPNKTYEGLFSSLILSIIFIVSFFFGANLGRFFVTSSVLNDTQNIAFYTLPLYLIIVLPLSSILGDLFFSWIKRINEVKDYSQILSGHGGILDRFDSVLFVNFFFIVALNVY